MVKPGLAYLDILRDIANLQKELQFQYIMSGEYAMLKAAAEKGWLDYNQVILEQLHLNVQELL